MTNKTFKHSGTFGDLIYSLPIVKYLGGGEFYLHLDQINWIGQYYYGSKPNPQHQGRMTQDDYEFMREFMLAQPYITKFDTLSKSTEISHNLDRFRPLFVGHPTNYIDIYSQTFKILDPDTQKTIRTEPWLITLNQIQIPGRDVVINRTTRWLPPTLSPQWELWRTQGLEDRALFIGLPDEYQFFKEQIGWHIPYYPCKSMNEMAQVIMGASTFIGNQSVALSLAIGLGKEYCCELRRDLPMERNECYFPDNPRGNYF